MTPKFWIVTDRMLSEQPHEYDQIWWLPVMPSQASFRYPCFTADHVHMEEAKKIIYTDEESANVNGRPVPKVNLAMHQFTAARPHYQSQERDPKPLPDGRMANWGLLKVSAKWQEQGNQQVITAILPKQPGDQPEKDLKEIHELHSGQQAYGFEALTPGGEQVHYMASTVDADDMTFGTLHAKAKALLLVGDVGMALDCSELSVNNQKVEKLPSDFEFTIANGVATNIVPIYRPIHPILIGPEQNVFTDSIRVSCTTQTPDVDIHYTTDGTDPTPSSSQYIHPFLLNHSAIVKARAYRLGVRENPCVLSGTQATVASTAVFTKTPELHEAVKPESVGDGMQCSYYEDDWRKLFLDLDGLKPQATGGVPSLWNFDVVPASNALVGKQLSPRAKPYAVVYSGYLRIPADGVYTLRAPREFVWPDTEAGGDLRVYLGANKSGGNDQNQPLCEWYPSTRLHALGTWSVALAKGLQPFKVAWIDYRTDSANRLNLPGLRDFVWTGTAPDLRISGPDLNEQAIPASWLCH